MNRVIGDMVCEESNYWTSYKSTLTKGSGKGGGKELRCVTRAGKFESKKKVAVKKTFHAC